MANRSDYLLRMVMVAIATLIMNENLGGENSLSSPGYSNPACALPC